MGWRLGVPRLLRPRPAPQSWQLNAGERPPTEKALPYGQEPKSVQQGSQHSVFGLYHQKA